MTSGFFITGTDTEIGKTYTSVLLIQSLKAKGLRVAAMKPVASGGYLQNGRLVNDDALQLFEAAGLDVPYEWVNPYCFEPAIAPHIAANNAGVTIELDVIKQAYDQLAKQADVIIVEGVGGWCVPLSENVSVPALAKHLDLPVILVVGMKLGCLNHALLTADRIQQDGLQLAGWMANCVNEKMPCLQENLATLKASIHSPVVAVIDYAANEIVLSNLELPRTEKI